MLLTIVFVLLGANERFGNGLPIEELRDSSGFFNQRIIGGVDAPEGHSPHMVALICNGFFEVMSCGGSIISSKMVLTAAHCIHPYVNPNRNLVQSFHGRVGSNQWNSGGVVVQFQGYINHPEWDPLFIKNDLGVIFLKHRLVFNERVASIPLAYDWVGGQQKAYAAGWGNTGPRIIDNGVHLAPTPDDLQYLYVQTLSHEQCSSAIYNASTYFGWAPHVDPVVELCTLHSIGHGMCNGDSGSALILQEHRRQVGVVSWSFPCAVGAPDVFVRISGFKFFLKTLLKLYG